MVAEPNGGQKLKESLRNKLLLSMAFAALIYFGFLVWSGWEDFVGNLQKFPTYLLLPVLGLSLVNYFIRYLKFDIYLRLLGYEVKRWLGFRIFLAGLAGTVTPGKLGEVLKSFLLERDCNAPIAKTAPIVVAERFTDLTALILLTLIGLKDIKGDWTPVVGGIGLVTAMFIIVSWRSLCNGIIDWLKKRDGFLSKVGEKLDEAYSSTKVMLAPSQLLIPSLISVLSWSCECLGFGLVLWGFGVKITIARATFIYCFATLAGALAMLPGGLGATEAIMIGFLAKSGVAETEATAATLIIRACTLWFAVLVGGLSLATLSPKDQK